MYNYLVHLFLFIFSLSFAWEESYDGYHDRKILLNLGESGFITDKNFSSVVYNVSTNNVTDREYGVIEITTCSYCVITIKFRYLNLKENCVKRHNIFGVSACRCEHIWIAEPNYEDVSGTPFCGYWNSLMPFGKSEPMYRSQTRSITIKFFSADGEDHEFSFFYSSERNRQIYSSSSQNSEKSILAGGYFTSPFFPKKYPRDLISEYILSCSQLDYDNHKSALNHEGHNSCCRIRLVFTDFQLASSSVMEFFDVNQQRIELTSGTSFRPPVIITNSTRLKVRFAANGGQNIGFKGLFSFIEGDYTNSSLEPNTDCGGLVEDLGGSITMVNMVHAGVKPFDCLWLIQPPKHYFSINGKLYLKVNTLERFNYAELEIREGLVSESPLLEKILHSSVHNSKEHITSPSLGFYVNLKASFEPSSILSISFTLFHYNKCFTGPEFLCRNQRCIPRKVVCDGFDHCGDGTDEVKICYKVWKESGEHTRKWDSLTPNYYFPKTEHYSALKTATLVFATSSIGLILFLVILIILLYRMGLQSRQQSEFDNRLQTITEFFDDAEIEEIIDDEPPLYEAPPDYEVAMKKKISLPLERQVRLMGTKNQKSEMNVIGGKIAISISESVRDCTHRNVSDEKCNECEGHDVPVSGTQNIPASPPPPYVEEEKENVIECTNDNQCLRPSSSLQFHWYYLKEGGQNSSAGSNVNMSD